MKLALQVSLLAGAVTAMTPFPLPSVQAQTQAPLTESHPRGGLPNFAAKLKAGGEVRVAYLGGSITESSGWRPLTTKWLGQQFPAAKVVEINAAIPGTGSDLGVYRLQRDVLAQNSDLVFVEFAVNDSGADDARVERAMEGIVRQVWVQNPRTDICFVYTFSQAHLADLQAGKLARSAAAMERVADHYGIPSVHMGLEVARLIGEGKMVFTGPQEAPAGGVSGFSADGTHPYPATGHPYYFAALQRSLPAIEATGTAAPHTLPTPLRQDNWEAAQIVPVPTVMDNSGWQELDGTTNPLPINYHKFMPKLWKATKPGQMLNFTFNGLGFGFGGAKGPDSGTFAVTVDNNPPLKATLFDSFSREGRYRIRPWFYPSYLAPGLHTVRIELLEEAPPKADILQKAGVPITDPTKFAGNNLYVGEVFVVGNLEKP